MKPVDPRLLAQARTTRVFLAGSVLLGGTGALLLLAQATLIAEIIVRCFQRGQGLGQLATPWYCWRPSRWAGRWSPGSPS